MGEYNLCTVQCIKKRVEACVGCRGRNCLNQDTNKDFDSEVKIRSGHKIIWKHELRWRFATFNLLFHFSSLFLKPVLARTVPIDFHLARDFLSQESLSYMVPRGDNYEAHGRLGR